MSDRASASRASNENAALLRRFYESFNQGDLDAVIELCTEDVEVYRDPEVVEMVAAFAPRGQERVAQYLRGWLDSWSEYTARPEEFLQSGEEVAALTHLRARGKNSQPTYSRFATAASPAFASTSSAPTRSARSASPPSRGQAKVPRPARFAALASPSVAPLARHFRAAPASLKSVARHRTPVYA
jgi:ketosteroid isomerase-like protein